MMSADANLTGSGIGNELAVEQLRCEYETDPLGMDGQDKLWDSGKVTSDPSVHVPYGGPALRPGKHCTWQVQAWDDRSRPSDWSETAWWEMGLLDMASVLCIGHPAEEKDPRAQYDPSQAHRNRWQS